MKTIIAPEVDMLRVSKNSQDQRKVMANFAPRIGLTVVDYAKVEAIDRFYIDCQDFRDYYRDPYNKLHRPESFKRHYGRCGQRCRDKNTILLSLPATWVRERKPVVCPIVYERRLEEGIHLGGHHDPTSCIKFKR